MMEESGALAKPFNSTLETGVRVLILLEAFYPARFDLQDMTWLDHLVVHTQDIGEEGAPPSLHPDLPDRAGEIAVRRRLIEQGLQLMRRLHLLEVSQTSAGVEYMASEETPTFLNLLQSSYSMELKNRAQWLARHFEGLSGAEMRTRVEARLGRWAAEFRYDESPRSGLNYD